ncbi:hypothetical protein [Mesorhizobium sp. A623]
MIPKPNIEALKALLASEPIVERSDSRSAVRKAMDSNAIHLRDCIERCHSGSTIVGTFMDAFPGLRESRPDLDDAAYRLHVWNTYNTIRRRLGISRPRSASMRITPRPTTKTVEQKQTVVEAAPVPVPETQVERPEVVAPKRTPVVEPAPAVSPIGRNKIRSLDDI